MRRFANVILCAAMWSACCFSGVRADEVAIVDKLPLSGANVNYVADRPPLAPVPLLKLPVGSITPHGWQRHELELEAAGMTGHLEEISPWCKFEGNAWTNRNGEGKNGWEEVPYWLRGYGDLGYVLGDKRIIDDAKRWIDAIIAAQADDGWFGPSGLRTSLKGKPDMWPHMPILNALQSYYEFTGDQRVITLMTRYFKWQLNCPDGDFFTGYWDRMRVGDNIESIYWLYNRTGDAWLMDLATKIYNHGANWTHGVPNWHNVNIAEGFREPATYALQSHDPSLTAATTDIYNTVMGIYGQVPGGGFGADENARRGHIDPRQGFETCGIVEFMHSFEMLTRFTGDPVWADRCEEIAFNDLPAALTPDLKGLHYLTCPNQVQLDKNNKSPGIDDRGTMFSYSPFGVYRCCQHNHGMGWPYYVEETWSATLDGGLCTTLYCSSDVTAKVADGKKITLSETTEYPFADSITLKFSGPTGTNFPLYLRIPRWCESPALQVNGQDVALPKAAPLTFVRLGRTWSDGDRITLKLPMRLAVRRWVRNDNSASVDYGPLTFALDIGQKWTKYGGTDQWPEFEVYPTTPWNYGLVLDAADPASSFELTRKPGPLADQPFTPQTTPISLTAKARKIDGWDMDRQDLIRPLRQSPVASNEPIENITLIPMGAARLRISAFPVIGDGPTAHPWQAEGSSAGLAAQATPSASFCFRGNSVSALNEGNVPQSSSDETIPRLTWWNHKGTAEYAQYDFKTPQMVSATQVYWFDDSGKGGCRVPLSWRLFYRVDGQWKPVEAASDYSTKLNEFNRVTFTPVKTDGLRVDVQLQPDYSGGILTWRVE